MPLWVILCIVFAVLYIAVKAAEHYRDRRLNDARRTGTDSAGTDGDPGPGV